MKHPNIIITSIATLGVIIAVAILGNTIKNRNQKDNTISVTGLGTKQFTSDLITWSGTFTRSSYDLKEAYNALSSDKKKFITIYNPKASNLMK